MFSRYAFAFFSGTESFPANRRRSSFDLKMILFYSHHDAFSKCQAFSNQWQRMATETMATCAMTGDGGFSTANETGRMQMVPLIGVISNVKCQELLL